MSKKNSNVVCSSEFFVFSIKPSINSDYFKYYISSKFVQNQIINSFSGARMPRINEDVFKAITIPIPPIDIQMKIAAKIKVFMAIMKTYKDETVSLKEDALDAFGEEIFR